MIKYFKSFWFNIVMKLTFFSHDWTPVMRLRGLLLKPCFKSCGTNFQIASNVNIYSDLGKIIIGNDVFIGYGTWILASDIISIGDSVMLAPYTIVVTSNHTLFENSYRFGKTKSKPITIGNGCWLGAGTKILPGVVLGNTVLCAAGSVVTKSFPPNCIIGGVPAKIINNNQLK